MRLSQKQASQSKPQPILNLPLNVHHFHFLSVQVQMRIGSFHVERSQKVKGVLA